MQVISTELENQAQFNFINSLKSPYTKQSYQTNIKLFMKYCNINKFSDLLAIKEPDKQIIDYIMHLRQTGLSTASISTMLYAIFHFYDMNDVILNKKRINRFKGESTLKIEDRPYTTEEIQKILNVSDIRMKVIIGLMYSAGLRIGAITELKLRNLEKIESCYKVTVYEGTNESYYSFVTPEVASFIDNYLGYRTKSGEQLHKDSFLIREQFNVTDLEQIRKPRSIATATLKIMLHTLLIKAGLRTVDHINPYKRKEVARAHGFRKTFASQCYSAKMNPETRERLLGHNIGLPLIYCKPTVEEEFTEYKKVIDLLTINEENRLRKRVNILQIEKSRLDQLELSLKRLEQKYKSK